VTQLHKPSLGKERVNHDLKGKFVLSITPYLWKSCM